MPNAATSRLLATQAPDGGWGAYGAASSRTEPTALATLALALAADPGAEGAVYAGRAWLEAAQRADGSWPLGAGAEEPNWSTSLAILTLTHVRPGSEAEEAGVAWLMAQKGRGSPLLAKVLSLFLRDRPAVDLDPELTGWPWAEGTFSWVEPTSYALLALKRRRAPRPRSIESRIREAERMLVDRVCEGGGWNYGNSVVLDDVLWPYPDTTALALLALADRPDLEAVRESLDRLPRMLDENDSVLSLGLGVLALSVHGRDPQPTRARLEERLDGGETGEIRALAWGAIGALDRPDSLGILHG